MKKSDLREGMMVELRNGKVLRVSRHLLLGRGIHGKLNTFQENLNHKYKNYLDIIKVADGRDYEGSINDIFDHFDKLPVLWERCEFKPGDKVEVRDGENQKWYRAYFIRKKGNSNCPWIVSFQDEFVMGKKFEDVNKNSGWRYIRKYEED